MSSQPRKYRLREDVLSIFFKGTKPKKYGSKGDIVTEISDCDNVLIVEDKKGERFAVVKTKLQTI